MINRVGGVFAGLVLLALLVWGVLSAGGQQVLGGIWQALRVIIGGVGDGISRVGGSVGAAGNLGRAIIIGLVVFAACILLIPATRAGRGLAIAAVASIILTLVLFQPSLGTSLRNAVSAPAAVTVLDAR